MRGLFLITLVFFFADDLFADHFRDPGWLAENGVLDSVRIEPSLPASGEPFSVNLTGSWPEKSLDGSCFAAPEIDTVVVHEGNRVQLVSNLQHDPAYCDQPPARWNHTVTIPASAWSAVNEEGFLRIEHLMASGINMLTGVNQLFDMRLGTHVVPAWLGSGFWVSSELPFEGMMIEQQGDRVLFYSLRYDRNPAMGDDGEPVWQMVSGKMYGNSTLGRAYRYDWPMGDGSQPAESPTQDELLTVNDSGAIIVNDFNHIRAFTELENGNFARYEDYTRLVFGIDSSRLPVYVPPLTGRWTLHGFDERNEMFMAELEFLEGKTTATNQYQFDSAEGNYHVQCTVALPGNGECALEFSASDLRFDFPLSAFQGNLARGDLQLENGIALDGVLVRLPWQLPVLDAQ
jgi:hypothetical protein